jgi:cytochrome d ubiquinol oxidase subunit II
VTLQTIWFILIFALLAGYAILDGFDLGVGALHLVFMRDERERRAALQAIGPVWDGNEVWLLTAGGALFAAFPAVYATVFSGFYLALVLLLVALMGRAVAIEFRSKAESRAWRRTWDAVFGLGSAVPPLLLGVTLGNILRGVPINAAGDYAGTFLGLLNPYALLVGVLALAAMTWHGAIYLAAKTDGPMHERLARLAGPLGSAALALYLAAVAASYVVSPLLFAGSPLVWVFGAVALGGILFAYGLVRRGRLGLALAASSAALGAMVAQAGAGLFPRLVPSSIDPAYSLTLSNASSTPAALTAMLVIALVGMPVVLAYTVWAHRVFKGKVTVTEEGY